MSRNKKKITLAEYAKSIKYTPKTFLDIMTVAVDFLDIIGNTLRNCVGVGLGACGIEGYDVGLLFHTYDDEWIDIGYVNYFCDENYHILRNKGCIYFFDSDFIYKRYEYFNSLKDCNHEEAIGKKHNLFLDKTDFYAYLFDIGVIEPFGECRTEPLQEISYAEDNEIHSQKCFCISSSLIDFDFFEDLDGC